MRPTRASVAAALAAVYVIWGSTYLAMRIALTSFTPFSMAGVRFLLAGAVLYGALRLRGARRPTPREWAGSALTGTLFLVAGNGSVAFAQQWVSSSLAAVMVASMPLFAAVFAGLWGSWPSSLDWAGLALGSVGVVLLNLGGELRASPVAAGLLLLAPLCWALGSVLSGRIARPAGALASATDMLCGGGIMLALALVEGRPWAAPTTNALAALAYLIVFGSIVAFSAYGFLLRNVRPALATSYAYVNPVVAIALGVLAAGESLSAVEAVGAAVILAGVGLVVLGKGLAQARVTAAPT